MPKSRSTDRSAWLTIASREISVRARDTGFLASVALSVVGIIAAIAASALIGDRVNHVQVAADTAYNRHVVERASEMAKPLGGLTISLVPVDSETSAHGAVEDGAADLGLVRHANGPLLIARTDAATVAAGLIRDAHAQLQLEHNARQAGTSVNVLLQGSEMPSTILQPGAMSSGTIRIVGAVLTFAFYILALMFGATVAQSVLEEKQNRIVEILNALVSVRSLLMGKLIGSAVISVAQVVLFAAAVVAGMSLRGSSLPIPRVSFVSVWFVVLFAVGLMGVNALWAVAGAMATRAEDLSSTATPVSLLLAAVLPVGMFLSGGALTIASMVPLVNVVALPTRMLAGPVPWWQIAVSLLGLLLLTVSLIRLAEMVYRRSLMMTERKLTIRQALASQS